MKIYVISGLGAGSKVLEKLEFSPEHEAVFLDWLIPEQNEKFAGYVQRMAENIDDSEDFYLLGYSFGGFLVQEINLLKPAKKTVILGSIKSDLEKPRLIKMGELTRIPKFLPIKFFDKSSILYKRFRRFFDPDNPKIAEYFQMRDPYYLKWSVERIAEWKFTELPDVVQILGDKDIVFPVKNSKPDYVIKNGTHLFPATKHREVSLLLKKIFV
ncbi:hypothetical protein ASG01_10840 [Chryseobacterium sp. Leaf180]|uniref:alpha/beta hydrolase n=1 Tax=Chryseobacterium sp. Leaf180 TaxID=1736289 RepID=UPI0006FD05AA|nr:alpha/beta hydrolase [Chryseobacterium sp. Leaf180]KQR92416.1 hypothetical protein ASG01_10840 [Chryseobacterium sp. Leaf180]